jgi:acyl-CoA thioesterase-1
MTPIPGTRRISTLKILHILILCITTILLTSCEPTTPEIKHLSPNDVIVAFGDSLTYGTGTTPTSAYPAVLEKITGIKIINEGVPGDDTVNGLKRITDVLNKHHPRLVILSLGGNDQLHKRPLTEIKANLKNIIQIIQRSGADVLLIAAPLPTLTLSVPDLYAELGEEMNISVDDTTLADLLGQSSMKSDYIHLNTDGYKALAESIAATLKKAGAVTKNE